MTIAACYVSSEGVVFGADSTTTSPPRNPSDEDHYFNHGQKLFEIGENSTLCLMTWGMGALGTLSYRTLVAQLSDQFSVSAPKSVLDACWRWSNHYFANYQIVTAPFKTQLQELEAKGNACSPEEEKFMANIKHNFRAGFCIGGWAGTRTPEAFQMEFSLDQISPPEPVQIPHQCPYFWGWPGIMNRLDYGLDDGLVNAIMESGRWTGTVEDLADIAMAGKWMRNSDLPLRDAIDWVYSSIFTTIKAMKFSFHNPYCGGPIEIATVTTDRRFRWVSHKSLDIAIGNQ